MSTTDTVVARAITLTEDDLGPQVTHASTRSWLTGPGLPCYNGLFRFTETARPGGPRTVAEVTGAADRLSPALRDRLVIGAFAVPAGLEPESVLLDGATGEVSSAYVQDRPDLMDCRPLALPADVRPLRGGHGRTGGPARPVRRLRRPVRHQGGRGGLAAAARGVRGGRGRRARAVLADGGADPPLALVAGPGTASGLALDLPLRLLDEEFGRGGVVRFEEVDFPATLTHEPTRRFLRETGLPEDGFLFSLDTDQPLRTLTEYAADDCGSGFPQGLLPAHADRLIRVGHLIDDHGLVVDGATGAVLSWSESDGALRPLNTDISTLAFTLWLLHRERSSTRPPATPSRATPTTSSP